LALSIERVNFVELFVIKAVEREIFAITFYRDGVVLSKFSSFPIEEEMMMSESGIIEKIYKEKPIVYKAGCDIRVWKIVDWHSKVIDANFRVNIKFFLLNFLKGSGFFSKCSQSKLAVI
jgi:hypothetical protein